MWHVIRWKFLQHLTGQSLHTSFSRLTATAATVLWLNANDGAERFIGQVGLVGDVSVGVEPKNLQTRTHRHFVKDVELGMVSWNCPVLQTSGESTSGSVSM